jgi:hypothetical protein
MNEKLTIVSLLGVAVIGTPAAAQDTRRMDFGVQARVVQDTNIAGTSDVLAQSRGVIQDDTLFSPTFTFDVLIPVSRQTFFANGAVGYDFYRKNDQLNRERLRLEGGAIGRLGPCQGTAATSYTRAQSDLRDITLIDPKNVLEQREIRGEVACSRSSGFGASVSVAKRWSDNSNVVQQLIDSETLAVTGAVNYARPTFGTLSIFAMQERTKYPKRPLLFGGPGGYELQSFGASFERRLGARLQGRVSAAMTTVDQVSRPLGGGAGKFNGPTYSAGLTFRPTDRLEALLDYERKVEPSKRLNKVYDLEEIVRLEGRYRIGSRIQTGLGGEIRKVDSKDAVLSSPPGLFLSDSETKSIFGSVTFKPSQRLSFIVDVTHEERETNLPIFDYSGTRVGASVGLAF